MGPDEAKAGTAGVPSSWPNRWLVAAIGLALVVNVVLLDKYNIFVGDDGILASHVFGWAFDGTRTQILCPDWNAHAVLLAVLGPLYRWYYGAAALILDGAGLPLHWINGASLLLFLATVALVAATLANVPNRPVALLGVLVLATLEPVLVASHSIRQDALMLFGIALLLHGLVRPSAPAWQVLGTTLGVFVLETHPSGYPPLVALALGTLLLRGWPGALRFAGAGLVATLAWLACNDFLSPAHLAEVREAFAGAGRTLGLSRWAILDGVRDYLLAAKYKRHLIELLIVAAWAAPVLRWRMLSREARVLAALPAITALFYVVMGYLNLAYISYLLLMMLVSAAWSWGEMPLGPRAWVPGLALCLPFLILYAGLAVMFGGSPAWGPVERQKSEIAALLPQDGHFAAPFSWVMLEPRRATFLPVSQLADAGACDRRFGASAPPTTVLVDTQNAAAAAPSLGGYREVRRFRIGRLATQSLDDSGELVVSVRP